MVSLRKQITLDMQQAMRARDTTRLETIRLLRAGIQRREVDERTELNNAEVLAVIQKMIKQGHDSIAQFKKGNRSDLVDKEYVTLEVLEAYMPEALGQDKIIALINEALAETGAKSTRDLGQVMGWLKPKLQGQADMATVSATVREQLNS